MIEKFDLSHNCDSDNTATPGQSEPESYGYEEVQYILQISGLDPHH